MPTGPSRIMNSFFLTSTIIRGCFHYLKPRKILPTLKESAKTFLRTGCRNTAFQLKTCFVLICHLTTNRIAEEQKQDGRVEAGCCFAHTLLYPRIRNPLRKPEMLTETRRLYPDRNPYCPREHFPRKELPALTRSIPGTRALGWTWLAEQWPQRCPHPSPGNEWICSITRQRATEADVMKVYSAARRWGDFPGSSGGPHPEGGKGKEISPGDSREIRLC